MRMRMKKQKSILVDRKRQTWKKSSLLLSSGHSPYYSGHLPPTHLRTVLPSTRNYLMTVGTAVHNVTSPC